MELLSAEIINVHIYTITFINLLNVFTNEYDNFFIYWGVIDL